MTILCALLVLLVAILVTTITSLYDYIDIHYPYSINVHMFGNKDGFSCSLPYMCTLNSIANLGVIDKYRVKHSFFNILL